MMKRYFIVMVLVLMSTSLLAANLENGYLINKNCAICHGQYGQGTPGRLSPRLAGLSEDYLIKAINEYKGGVRVNPTMMMTSGIGSMSAQDIEDVAYYLSSIDLSRDAQFDIKPSLGGDRVKGEAIYDDECRFCHRRDGFGKDSRGVPAIAGQHTEYLFQNLKMFQTRLRIHDDDPDDTLFDRFSDEDIINLTAYAASLDDRRIINGADAYLPRVDERMVARMAAAKEAAAKQSKKVVTDQLTISDITQTVAQMPLKDGVSIEDAIDAMRSKAVELNLKMVGEQQVSQELAARDVESPHLSIYQFCDPMDAREMIIANPIFASYMPCRISMVEDQEGVTWLMMLNLDMLINSKLLPPQVVETAIRVNQAMLDVMIAGATGEF
ncbi:DUF302 domain-containing protein [Ectothiorhodospiraceae bacterium BW-2]|nr:DUF302 domain-containing protein [Ectothiorhodospiraceae bacterium BW-2]